MYDLIIVGSGSVGSSAGYYASKSGSKVLMIDNGTPPHTIGSHHGSTRIIRCAYGEGEKYVPMLLRARKLWGELNEITGEEVINPCGVLNMGPKDSGFMLNAEASARKFNLNVEILTPTDVRERWPGIMVPDDYVALFEPEAGFLRSEVAVGVFVRLSKEAGAEQLFNTTVTSVDLVDNGVEVTTSAGKFISRKVLISAGTWVRKLLPQLPIQPTRKIFSWHQADERYEKTPGFVIDTGDANYYGFPKDASGFKVGKHVGGQKMNSRDDYVPFGELEEDETEVSEFLNRFFDGVGQRLHGAVCSYDMTPDEDFIICPIVDNIMVVSGLSGHGFKFVSVLGEIAANFARGEQSPYDLAPFSLKRFQ